ncbi:MAG TPA: hypothetical protein PK222_06060 [Bacteroidales bacterium]|jgi:hypothetical protein|nr:hypothetical protein [Bacteroidales bacterium]HQL12084.1 hypothetical protein [bacterium]
MKENALKIATEHLLDLQNALEQNDKKLFREILDKIIVSNDIILSGEMTVGIGYSNILLQAIQKWINY